MEKEIKLLLSKIKARKRPYVELDSPFLLSSDCYDWARIESDLLDLVKSHLTAHAADPKVGSADLGTLGGYNEKIPMR